jgi:hypothetical protein
LLRNDLLRKDLLRKDLLRKDLLRKDLLRQGLQLAISSSKYSVAGDLNDVEIKDGYLGIYYEDFETKIMS